jgi:hypothetical protein
VFFSSHLGDKPGTLRSASLLASSEARFLTVPTAYLRAWTLVASRHSTRVSTAPGTLMKMWRAFGDMKRLPTQRRAKHDASGSWAVQGPGFRGLGFGDPCAEYDV